MGSSGAGLAAANLAAVLTIHGRLEEALRWQDRAEEIFGREGSSALQGRLAVAQAVTLLLAGEEEGAWVSIRRARELLGEDDWGSAWAEAEVQSQSKDTGGYMKYMELFKECHTRDDNTDVAHCAMRLGRIEGTTGGRQAALEYYTMALEILRAERDPSGIGLALRNVGLALRKLRQYPESEAAFREALDLAHNRGDRRLIVEILNDLSVLYAEMGDNARARDWDLEAEEALQSIAEDLKRGQLTDTVLLDFYRFLKVRYVNRAPYDTDLFVGFYDQLVLRPLR